MDNREHLYSFEMYNDSVGQEEKHIAGVNLCITPYDVSINVSISRNGRSD